MHVIEVRDGDLLEGITRQAKELGITDAAIVALIGAADSFTVSTMPAADATADVLTDYPLPAEMTATGEIVDGVPHVHAVTGRSRGTCTGRRSGRGSPARTCWLSPGSWLPPWPLPAHGRCA
jgi:predicted DNA-binding protein with PD1-like motif